MDDASDIMLILNDEETAKYLIGPPYPVSIEQVKDYLLRRPSINGHCLAWAIRHGDRLIGEVGLACKEPPQTYELGYYLSRHYWNTGITSLSVTTFLNMIIPKLNHGADITITAGYIRENLASGKILSKCGFMQVGNVEKQKHGQTLLGIEMVRIFPGKARFE